MKGWFGRCRERSNTPREAVAKLRVNPGSRNEVAFEETDDEPEDHQDFYKPLAVLRVHRTRLDELVEMFKSADMTSMPFAMYKISLNRLF